MDIPASGKYTKDTNECSDVYMCPVSSFDRVGWGIQFILPLGRHQSHKKVVETKLMVSGDSFLSTCTFVKVSKYCYSTIGHHLSKSYSI